MTPLNHPERRAHHRFQTQKPARLLQGDRERLCRATLRNIGFGGALLTCDHSEYPAEPGESLTLEIQITRRTQRYRLPLHGVVAWVQPGRVAFTLLGVGRADYPLLHSMITYHAGRSGLFVPPQPGLALY
ncbi:MAG: PilZ domain-containing protein [Magnetococcus sp. WYHC-3]